jgi:hypothetical protein
MDVWIARIVGAGLVLVIVLKVAWRELNTLYWPRHLKLGRWEDDICIGTGMQR